MQEDSFVENPHHLRLPQIGMQKAAWFRNMYHFLVAGVLCLALFMTGIFSFPVPAAALEKKNVLILNSYHQGFKWTDDISRGMLAALEPVRSGSRMYPEYLDTKWEHGTPYFTELARFLRIKYAKIPIDLILCADNDALDFLLVYRDEVFGKIPVVFCGANYFKSGDLKGRSFYTGVSENAELKDSLDVALTLHPGTKQIFVINDYGTPGRKVLAELKNLLPLYQNKVVFTFENSSDLEEVAANVAKLPPDSLIFYTFFYGNPDAKFHENSESISLISEHARVPVYGAWDFNLGYGR